MTRYSVVTPVRNEAEFIGRTVESMLSQTVVPQRWIVVDDGDYPSGAVGCRVVNSHAVFHSLEVKPL